jgi:hypothetical protein
MVEALAKLEMRVTAPQKTPWGEEGAFRYIEKMP